jgi:hypothetical protein
MNDTGIFCTGEKQELLALMAPDVTEDAAVFFLLKKPGRPRRGIQAVRARAKGLNDFSDGPGGYQLSSAHGTLDMDALTIIDGVFFSGGLASATRLFQLIESGERRFVGEIILTGLHHTATKRLAFIWHSSGSDELNLGIVEDFLKTPCRTGVGKFF